MSRASRQREADARAAAQRKAAEKAEREAVEARTIKEALDIGRTGSMEAFKEASHKSSLTNNLLKGATQAFVENGHHEKIQYIFSNWNQSCFEFKDVLLDLTKGKDSEQAVAAVKLAVDTLSKEKRQAVLDKVLFQCVAGREVWEDYKQSNVINKSEEDLIGVLLQADANPNAYDGKTFALAILNRSISDVKALRAHGAQYKNARLVMEVEGWADAHQYKYRHAVEKLNAYEGHENADPIAELRQNGRDLSVKVGGLTVELKAVQDRLDGPQPRRNAAGPAVLRK